MVLAVAGGGAKAVDPPVPSALEVGPVNGLAVLSDRSDANRLALFMLSQHKQAILAKGGLLPVVKPQ